MQLTNHLQYILAMHALILCVYYHVPTVYMVTYNPMYDKFYDKCVTRTMDYNHVHACVLCVLGGMHIQQGTYWILHIYH